MDLLNYNLRCAVSMAHFVHKKITYEEMLLPINVEDIIKYRPDIKVAKEDLLGLDGYSIYNDVTKKYVIALDNVNFELSRQRFTLAHELGHIFLQHHTKYKYLSDYVKEKSADAFAGELLMPRDMMYKTAKFPPNYVLNVYGVSYQAYKMRKLFLDDMENFSKRVEDEKSMSLDDIIQYTKHSLILNDCY
ncbi:MULTISPECIES: ImmA/IrrE family metallo-endopeptidase [Peptoniphilus]|uniref:ImmA/IrrE family metallo-endopeptidase n=1 Tax=Peptoniphilus TaxID=162289 RepID=UPI00290EF5E4|nr:MULTISPECIES: ImmA/IrrE family metallo-endopeptidase [Peptoniphilus]MDU5274441.1 ImmA/IrrE family metallo-endopeptidase [Peptoniphilus lacydonensis]MDU5594388.1 ImmA/IrrE family metallo-endopeptidase [Peptoniphilus rhinitidis]